MNWLVRMYRPYKDDIVDHVVYADQYSVHAIAENLSRMLSDSTENFHDVQEVLPISDIYPIEAR